MKNKEIPGTRLQAMLRTHDFTPKKLKASKVGLSIFSSPYKEFGICCSIHKSKKMNKLKYQQLFLSTLRDEDIGQLLPQNWKERMAYLNKNTP
jgi:hypothetical protein